MWCTPQECEKIASIVLNMQVRPLDWRKIPSSFGAAVGFGIVYAYHRPPIWNVTDHGIVDAVSAWPSRWTLQVSL